MWVLAITVASAKGGTSAYQGAGGLVSVSIKIKFCSFNSRLYMYLLVSSKKTLQPKHAKHQCIRVSYTPLYLSDRDSILYTCIAESG